MAALASPARKLLKLSPLPPRSASLVAKGQRTMLQDTPLSNSRPMTRSSCKPRSPDWKRSFDANRQRLLRSTRPRVQYAHPSHPADARPPGAARHPNGHDRSTQAMCAVGSHPPPCGVVGPGPLSRRPGDAGHHSLRASAGGGPPGTWGGGDPARGDRHDAAGPGPGSRHDPRVGLDLQARSALSLPAGTRGSRRAAGPHLCTPSALSFISSAPRC